MPYPEPAAAIRLEADGQTAAARRLLGVGEQVVHARGARPEVEVGRRGPVGQVVDRDHRAALPLDAMGEQGRVGGLDQGRVAPAELGRLAADADQAAEEPQQRARVAALVGDVDLGGTERAAGERADEVARGGGREAAVAPRDHCIGTRTA